MSSISYRHRRRGTRVLRDVVETPPLSRAETNRIKSMLETVDNRVEPGARIPARSVGRRIVLVSPSRRFEVVDAWQSWGTAIHDPLADSEMPQQSSLVKH